MMLCSCGGGCKKSEMSKSFVQQQIKDYFAFREGTYWVYQSQDSTKIDCVYVSSYTEKWENITRGQCTDEQNIFVELNSTDNHLLNRSPTTLALNNRSLYPKDGIKTFNPSLSFDYDIEIFKRIREYTMYSTEVIIDLVTKESGYITGISKQEIKFTLNNKSYSGEMFNVTTPENSSIIYHQRNIGIIGWVNGADTFNLTSYKIIQ
jgi:hypothetical protein